MSEIRLYMDEDTLRGALVQALRNASVDLVTTAEVNNLGQIDSEQLIWATLQQRVIYTFNGRDFCRLHFTPQDAIDSVYIRSIFEKEE